MKLFEHEINEASHTLELTINAPKFDASICGEFQSYVDDLLTHPWRGIVLDLSSVTFIDSSGVGALLSVQKQCSNQNESIALRGVTPTVRSIIELLRLQRVFTLQET